MIGRDNFGKVLFNLGVVKILFLDSLEDPKRKKKKETADLKNQPSGMLYIIRVLLKSTLG